MKSNISAIVFSIAIVASSIIIGVSYLKKSITPGTIDVTGLGNKDFISDLIVWEGEFTETNLNLQKAYSDLEKDKKIVQNYLKSNGVSEGEIVFKAIGTRKNTRSKYSESGKYMGDEFLGYTLSQSIIIESMEVEKIEKLSREITELINKGVQFYSEAPRYYYTKLADLKIEMISKATEDARLRAEKIAENSGGKLGDLISAKMGIFQITGQNSKEEYSWGGTFNTSSKKKTASITIKLRYKAI